MIKSFFTEHINPNNPIEKCVGLNGSCSHFLFGFQLVGTPYDKNI